MKIGNVKIGEQYAWKRWSSDEPVLVKVVGIEVVQPPATGQRWAPTKRPERQARIEFIDPDERRGFKPWDAKTVQARYLYPASMVDAARKVRSLDAACREAGDRLRTVLDRAGIPVTHVYMTGGWDAATGVSVQLNLTQVDVLIAKLEGRS